MTLDALWNLHGWAADPDLAQSVETVARRRGGGIRFFFFTGPGLLLLGVLAIASYFGYRKREPDKARDLEGRLKSGGASALTTAKSFVATVKAQAAQQPQAQPGNPPAVDAQAADPTTPADVLSRIARDHPGLRPVVARNPSASAELIEWLRSLRDPAVDAAIASRAGAGSPARRFNPPPNWPVPPGDWSPAPDWKPDPSWPPAPPGWQFWVA